MKNLGLCTMRVVAVGGNANNSGNTGAFCVNANNGVSTTNTNIGRQLSLLSHTVCTRPHHLVKHKASPKVLVAKAKAPGVNKQRVA